MVHIPDIDETERWIVRTTLRERYGRDMDFEIADVEVRLEPSDRELTLCPAILWQSEDGCRFLIVKSGERVYRCQFFYRPHRQFGTGTAHYDNLADCTVALLQAQADYAAESRGDLPGAGR
jgi:hypothetical protein